MRYVSKHGEVHVSLVASKGKVRLWEFVVSSHAISIPRLELQAAVLSVHMDCMLQRELKIDLVILLRRQ